MKTRAEFGYFFTVKECVSYDVHSVQSITLRVEGGSSDALRRFERLT